MWSHNILHAGEDVWIGWQAQICQLPIVREDWEWGAAVRSHQWPNSIIMFQSVQFSPPQTKTILKFYMFLWLPRQLCYFNNLMLQFQGLSHQAPFMDIIIVYLSTCLFKFAILFWASSWHHAFKFLPPQSYIFVLGDKTYFVFFLQQLRCFIFCDFKQVNCFCPKMVSFILIFI